MKDGVILQRVPHSTGMRLGVGKLIIEAVEQAEGDARISRPLRADLHLDRAVLQRETGHHQQAGVLTAQPERFAPLPVDDSGRRVAQ